MTGESLDQPHHDHAKHGREGQALDPCPSRRRGCPLRPVPLCDHPIDEVQGTVDLIAVFHHRVHQLRWSERIVDRVECQSAIEPQLKLLNIKRRRDSDVIESVVTTTFTYAKATGSTLI